MCVFVCVCVLFNRNPVMATTHSGIGRIKVQCDCAHNPLMSCLRGKTDITMLCKYLEISPFLTGEKSSRDEQVACAMLGTQLDNFLGGDPIQHRHVQGYESPEFMNLFPRGVSYKVENLLLA